MKKFSRYTITSALPYANGEVHIGHMAGVYLPADIYARYLRSKGEDVLFIGGSDEHGVPITIKAKKEGITPQDVVDRYHNSIKQTFKDFNISFDVYSRTSAPLHHETSSEFFTDLYNKGVFIEQESEQYYDEANNQFLADRYITGTCPNCKSEGAYGDQCESCGSSLSPKELINPKSALSGAVPILKNTKHWYLPLDKMQPELEKWIDGHKGDWKPNVYGQCKSWLDSGLRPRAVTRDLNWGVKVPVEGADGKVLYVWFDAPIGYISASKEWANEAGKDWKTYWQDEDSKLVHFIGKDNIVFHTIIFPAMLMAQGDYILPENVPANEFLNLENNKISTSRNWAVWLPEYLKDFVGKGDILRYVLCANAPEAKDNDFTWKDFQAKNNNELVAVLGNFLNRAVVLTHKYYEGKVPERGELNQQDQDVLDQLAKFPSIIGEKIEKYRFKEALFEVISLARLGNKYLADTEPWKLVKEDEEKVKTIMNIALQISASLAVVLEPFLPESAAKMNNLLGLENKVWADAGDSDLLPGSHQINKAEILFPKIEDEEIEAQMKRLEDIKIENKAMEDAKAKEEAMEEKSIEKSEIKPEVAFDDFMKMDIRVATVLECEKVEKADKLLKFLLDTGIDQRIVVSGIAEHYAPEDLVGKQVSVLMNLAPRKIRGVVSQGMILSAENADGSLKLISPYVEVDNGAQIG
ncbi:MAG: methionine--tRNA ligase [Flavobacteriales bacterium]|nr:methionine--tRNA ligase [Flavobacteriales bacterium]